jgi:hypothetical protein
MIEDHELDAGIIGEGEEPSGLFTHLEGGLRLVDVLQRVAPRSKMTWAYC